MLPQEFVVDDQDGIGDPTGMTGTRLEVNVHVITCSSTAAQNTVTCVNRAGLEVIDTVLTQLAAAEACLTPGREGAGRRARGHRRRHHRPRHLREGLALAHRRAAGRRRALHQRRGGGAAHAGERGGEDQEEARLRAHLDGARRRTRSRCRAWAAASRASWRGRCWATCCRRAPRRSARWSLTEIRRAGFDRSLNSGVVLTGGGGDPGGHARDRGADLRHAGAARHAVRDRRARGRGGEPGLLDRGRPRAVRAIATAPGRGARRVRVRRRRGPSARSPAASWAGCRTSSDGGPTMEIEDAKAPRLPPRARLPRPRVARGRRGPTVRVRPRRAGSCAARCAGPPVIAAHCKRICLRCGS